MDGSTLLTEFQPNQMPLSGLHQNSAYQLRNHSNFIFHKAVSVAMHASV